MFKIFGNCLIEMWTCIAIKKKWQFSFLEFAKTLVISYSASI